MKTSIATLIAALMMATILFTASHANAQSDNQQSLTQCQKIESMFKHDIDHLEKSFLEAYNNDVNLAYKELLNSRNNLIKNSGIFRTVLVIYNAALYRMENNQIKNSQLQPTN